MDSLMASVGLELHLLICIIRREDKLGLLGVRLGRVDL
jgi:hypothetical protein